DAGGRRGGDAAGVSAAGTGGAVAVAADKAAIGLDLDLQEGGVLGAADGGERAAAAPAVALVAGQRVLLGDRGQGSMVPAARPRPARLRAAPPGWGVAARRGRDHPGRGGSLGLAAKELLLAE